MEVDQPLEAPSKAVQQWDEFMTLPSPDELEMVESQEAFKQPLLRQHTDYKNTSERFFIAKRTFDKQYAEIYYKRLQQMKPFALERARTLWGKEKLPIKDKLLGISDNERCIIVGTLFKEMPLVPRVLDQFTKERAVPALPPKNFVSADDKLLLEDETGRTVLVGEGKFSLNTVVTGMVVAVKGTSLKGGEFDVEDISYCDIPAQLPLKRDLKQPDQYVALISGTRVGDTNQNPLFLQMFADYVAGHLGDTFDEKLASSIVRVIFAGNSVAAPEQTAEGSVLKHETTRLTRNQQNALSAPLRELEAVLLQLCDTVSVDIMPGESDPANYALPQQPFRRALFPRVSDYSSFQAVSNPYECDIGGRTFLGTAGQTIDNIERYVVVDDKLNILEQTLKWRHIAPTAPDQLGCYPFTELDPFVIGKCPHVYFIGNQKKFQTKLITGDDGQQVRLICVPSFADTPTIVLVNLNTLNVHPITFSTSL